MATTHLRFSTCLLPIPFSPPSPSHIHPPPILFSSPSPPCSLSHTSITGSRNRNPCFAAAGGDLLGDFGGRDPFPAEIESRFGEKVLGNVNTEHKILIPSLAALSLAQLECIQVSPSQSPMSAKDAQQLIRKVVGWRLVDSEGSIKLQCLWKLRDYKAAVVLINRIYEVIEKSNHYPNLHLEQPNQLRAELWTSSIGGLSMNDFIVAAKIDEIVTSDLVPKRRAWA